MAAQLRLRDVLYLFGVGFVLIGMLTTIAHFAGANPLDAFLLYFFAAAIAWIWGLAFRFIRFARHCDGVGATLAVLLATSGSIVIVLIVLFLFYHFPDLW